MEISQEMERLECSLKDLQKLLIFDTLSKDNVLQILPLFVKVQSMTFSLKYLIQDKIMKMRESVFSSLENDVRGYLLKGYAYEERKSLRQLAWPKEFKNLMEFSEKLVSITDYLKSASFNLSMCLNILQLEYKVSSGHYQI